MRISLRMAWYLTMGIGSIGWSLFTMRPESLAFTGILLLALLIPATRNRRGVVVSIALLAVVSPLIPIGLTFGYSSSGPKLVACCPGRFGSPDAARTAQIAAKNGECVLCSDVTTGFEPKYYLIW